VLEARQVNAPHHRQIFPRIGIAQARAKTDMSVPVLAI